MIFANRDRIANLTSRTQRLFSLTDAMSYRKSWPHQLPPVNREEIVEVEAVEPLSVNVRDRDGTPPPSQNIDRALRHIFAGWILTYCRHPLQRAKLREHSEAGH